MDVVIVVMKFHTTEFRALFINGAALALLMVMPAHAITAVQFLGLRSQMDMLAAKAALRAGKRLAR